MEHIFFSQVEMHKTLKKSVHCQVTVTQFGTEFVPGNYVHSHTGVQGILEDTLVRAKVGEKSSKHKSLAAKLLVESEIQETDPKEHVPNPANQAKIIHRARSHERPKEPKQLTDSIYLAYAEVSLEFLISDIYSYRSA